MGATTRVTFLRDFRSAATAEAFYTAGTTATLPAWAAGVLLAEGVVVSAADGAEVPPSPPLADAGAGDSSTPAPAPKPARKTAAKKKVSRGLD